MLENWVMNVLKCSKQPIIIRYLEHVTGYQPIRDQCFLKCGELSDMREMCGFSFLLWSQVLPKAFSTNIICDVSSCDIRSFYRIFWCTLYPHNWFITLQLSILWCKMLSLRTIPQCAVVPQLGFKIVPGSSVSGETLHWRDARWQWFRVFRALVIRVGGARK